MSANAPAEGGDVLVPEPARPRPSAQPAISSSTVEATTNAMSAVRWSMRVVRQARDRAEKRVEGLVREVAVAKRKMTEMATREQRLRKTLEELRAENAQASSDLSRVKKENGQMRLQTKDLSSRRETLMAKLDKTKSDAEKERQVVEDRLLQKCRHLKDEFDISTETIDDLKAQLAAGRGLQDDLQFNLDTSRKTHTELKEVVSELLESGQKTVSEIEEALLTAPTPTT